MCVWGSAQLECQEPQPYYSCCSCAWAFSQETSVPILTELSQSVLSQTTMARLSLFACILCLLVGPLIFKPQIVTMLVNYKCLASFLPLCFILKSEVFLSLRDEIYNFNLRLNLTDFSSQAWSMLFLFKNIVLSTESSLKPHGFQIKWAPQGRKPIIISQCFLKGK